jgi:hypothetical protein
MHLLPFLAGIVLAALVMVGYKSETAGAAPDGAHPATLQEVQADNSDCLFCHMRRFTTTFPDGEKLLLTIDEEKFNESVHGENQVACADCHADFTTFPHPDLNVNSVREFSTTYYTICQDCHTEQYDQVQDSVHQRALAQGNTNAAVCSDCHDPHEQKRLTSEDTGQILATARVHIPETCAQCHGTIYDQYKESVHGKALTEENNVDVPTCIDCHGVHSIQDPTTATFRNSTPGLCANCHTNADIMDKYGISTNVLDTYIADFHGSTVKLFEEQFPDQPTNKPVCTDCHGIHDILKVDEPNAGIALKENLLGKCQRCHPDATANFPGAWMSHYEASPEHYPIVYYVNLFYKFFIPTVLGGMSFFVLTDIYRRIINRRKAVKHQ